MRKRIIICIVVAVAALSGCMHHPVTRTDSNQPVISIEHRPTMFRVISERSGREITPGIDIFADGRCSVRTFGGEELERNLRRSEVKQLLEFFDRQGLFSISDELIERAISRELQPTLIELPDGSICVSSRGPVVTVDGTNTRIAAHTSTQKVEISRYAMHSELEHYRTVTELQPIQRCIEGVYAVVGEIY